MKGLDLRRLKKVASDDKTTTFKHDMGHEIKIVHSMLSPKMLKEIQDLPGAKMADGGQIKGVHEGETEEGASKSSQGKSMAGIFARHANDPGEVGESSRRLAKGEHEKVLGALRSMKKPELYAGGGETGVNKETTKKGVSEAGAKLNPAFSVGGKKWDTENAKDAHRKTLGELQSMPKPQLYADGTGDVQPDPAPNSSPDTSQPQAPVNIYVGGQGQQQPNPQPNSTGQMPQTAPAPGPVPVPSQFVQGQSDAGPTATTGSNPNSNAPVVGQMGPPAPAGTPSSSPDTNPIEPTASIPTTTGQIATQPVSADVALAHLNEQSAQLRQEFNNGQITPKTYADLFAKNDDGTDRGTLSKIGMLFGMLVGGAGSGLAHQPNIIMGMMDNEIKNDLEAQKQTKSNQFNALNLAESHYRNEVLNHFTQQQGAQTESATRLSNAQLPIFKLKNASDLLDLAAKQKVNDMSGLVPENSAVGQKARAMAGLVSNAVDSRLLQRNQQAAQQIAMNGQQVQQGANPEQQEADQNQPPVGSGDLLSAKATPQVIMGLSSPANAAFSEVQKGELSKQYQNVRSAEASLAQIGKLFPQLRENATATDIYGQSLSSLPWVGKSAENFLDNITGGNQQRTFKTDKESFTGYATNAFTALGMTSTDAANAAKDFIPADGDDSKTYNNRVDKLRGKIISIARAKAPMLDSMGFLKN